MARKRALAVAASTAAAVLAAEKPAPKAGWDFRFPDFVLAAWNPPAATEAEYRVYREAGFNLVMTPRYDLPSEALDLAAKHGLAVMVDTYTPHDKPWGGTASAYTPHPFHHPATVPELRWLHERYGKHPSLAGYLLGDDFGALPPELVDTTAFLRENAPSLFPWVCQNVMSAVSLAGAGNPIQNPQIYPTLYQSEWPASEQAAEFCRQLRKLRDGCAHYGLTPWPMLNVCGVASDSLVRFQVYASLAYGAQGIWYFTYRDGLRKGHGGTTDKEVREALLPSWQVAAETNRQVAAWGPDLLGRGCAGVFSTAPHTLRTAPPGPGAVVVDMSDDLLVGVLLDNPKSPVAMVVDCRVSKEPGAMGDREVHVRFADAVESIVVVDQRRTRSLGGTVAKLVLRGGEGRLLVLEGPAVAERCVDIEKRPPRRIPATVREDGLVLHLTFDEGEGDRTRDRSGMGNDVTLCGAEWVDGKSGRAIRLAGSGTSGRLIEPLLPAAEAMTIAAWVRPGYPTRGYGPVVYIGSSPLDRFEFGFGPDNLYPVITDRVSDSRGRLYVADMKGRIPEGTWGHIAVCAGEHGATTYVNGVAAATTSYTGRFDVQDASLFLGIRGTEEYDGDLDDVKVWNRCLAADEIRTLVEAE